MVIFLPVMHLIRCHPAGRNLQLTIMLVYNGRGVWLFLMLCVLVTADVDIFQQSDIIHCHKMMINTFHVLFNENINEAKIPTLWREIKLIFCVLFKVLSPSCNPRGCEMKLALKCYKMQFLKCPLEAGFKSESLPIEPWYSNAQLYSRNKHVTPPGTKHSFGLYSQIPCSW